jgi:arylsulfatase A-like enzyme
VFLTADHGAGHNPNLLADHKIPGGYWLGSQTQKELNAMLEDKYKAKNVAISFTNSQGHLNHKLIAQNSLDEEAIKTDIVNFLRRNPAIAFAIINSNPGDAALPGQLKNMIANSYNTKRSGAITIILQPGWYSGSSTTGTGSTHASWNPHDTHIPLVWMGWGIKHGSTNKHTNITDIAPTIAALLHIQEPNGCVGEPIEALLR